VAWFVAQVWVLCAVAFLLGAGVTWLLFVRPLRRRAPAGAPGRPPRAAAADPDPVAPPEPEPQAGPTADRALASLDTPPFGAASTPGAGVRASGALDLLGVNGAGAAPVIPTQPGPPDDEPRG